jgi:antitoxin component of MazEF toxin-antitoxin module
LSFDPTTLMSHQSLHGDVIETVADGLRLQAGDLPGDLAPHLLKAKPGAYVVGFAAGISRALDVEVGNHTIRIIERGCRQGIATRLVMSKEVTQDDELAKIREEAEEEGRAFVEDRSPPSGFKTLVYPESA